LQAVLAKEPEIILRILNFVFGKISGKLLKAKALINLIAGFSPSLLRHTGTAGATKIKAGRHLAPPSPSLSHQAKLKVFQFP